MGKHEYNFFFDLYVKYEFLFVNNFNINAMFFGKAKKRFVGTFIIEYSVTMKMDRYRSIVTISRQIDSDIYDRLTTITDH